ncbi:MAG: hypothetical protein AB1631_05635 [Acidobacteriota bacterium]
MKRVIETMAGAAFLIILMMAGLTLRDGRKIAHTAILPSVHAQGGCSNSTLNGSYRYIFNGNGFATAAAPPRPTGATAPFAAAGIVTFNGDGTLSGADTASLVGTILNRAYTGTYTVNADCSGFISLDFYSPFTGSGPANIVVAPDGSEMLFINTIQGATVLGEFRKQ